MITPRISGINFNPLPTKMVTNKTKFNSLDWALLESWEPDPDDFGALKVEPGCTEKTATGLSANHVTYLGYGEKSDQTRRVFATAGTSAYIIDQDGTTHLIKSGLTADTPMSSVTYGDLVLFFNGIDTPWKYDFTSKTSSAVSNIGLTQPDVTLSSSAIKDSLGSVEQTVKFWVSYVTSTTEGPLSDSFGTIDAGNGSTITLSSLPVGPGGTTARKIYMSIRNRDEPFYAVTITDNVTTSVDIALSSEELGDIAPTKGQNPPVDLRSPLVFYNRVYGWSGASDILYSDLLQPESWETSINRHVVWANDGDRGIALAAHPQGIVAFKKNHIYLLQGKDPEAEVINIVQLSLADQQSYNIGCSAEKSVTQTSVGVFFYYRNGFYLIDKTGKLQYLSKEIEDELRTDILSAEESKITARYFASQDTVWVSVPTTGSGYGSLQRTYKFKVSDFSWRRLDQGFTAFVEHELGTDLQASTGTALWGARTKAVPDGKVHLLRDNSTGDWAGVTKTATAQTNPLFFGSPHHKSRFMQILVTFEPLSGESLTVSWKIDGQTTWQTASILITQAGVSQWTRSVGIGSVGNSITIKLSYSGTAQPKIYTISVLGQRLHLERN